ncbi:ISRSO10-transposase orfB protein [Burkholderia ambifaria MEX-5]|uniref:ISRSO10-transposase orfB protein n=1 Tax=Burkholderia ambifaria MEX-5 TaxID=396597 RepID=B1TD57_9BURK|nr:hypothetical protein [Burkholderia ambifaria]EDT38499.1 ISRSO10-transposase orfB protein [Burkholderia ambifaria MEX-5]
MDYGSGYGGEKACAFTADIGPKPLTTVVCSPQSEGMTKRFVKTIKRDYVAFLPLDLRCL